jgi:O-methyltransferase involved in polyketide biosynthesis
LTEIQDVIGTAFIVAEYRAQENAEQDPLYRDPIVPLFLREQVASSSDGRIKGAQAKQPYAIAMKDGSPTLLM